MLWPLGKVLVSCTTYCWKKKLLHNSIKSTIFLWYNSFNDKEENHNIIIRVSFQNREVLTVTYFTLRHYTTLKENNLLRSYLRCTSSGVAFNNDDEVMSDPMNTSIDPNFLLSLSTHLGPTQKNFSMTRKS